MARKILLATALAYDAKVIIADEPTPGLDDSSLNEVLKDFRELADDGRAILMITHDIEAALKIADKVAIFYAGTTFEVANVQDFDHKGDRLRHPYTRALNKARPDIEFIPAEGTQPYPGRLPSGCLFSDRCNIKAEKCDQELPPFKEIRDGKVRCFHAT
jgi:peptide/nickel transport system ATP-binding protein